MTVDLLPPRSTPTSSLPAVGTEAATPSRDRRDGQHGWTDVEQNCPYCAGPETD
ncbi:hypothetical protein RCG67_16040 [Kocuria sp. CPCC 205292]|uniref:hypothetical protein n=1 Tax=Kocuria TaxID=57493 RepID=UPI0012F933A4|nr:hypothetical protein [Kocuria polaris]